MTPCCTDSSFAVINKIQNPAEILFLPPAWEGRKSFGAIPVLPALTTDETGGLQDLFLLLFLTPQISKGVNNDPEDEVEDDDDDNKEEEEVVDNSSREQGLL